MWTLPSCRGHHFVGCVFHGVAHNEVESGIHQNLLAFLYISPFEAQHHRKFDVSFLRGLHNSRCQRIHAQNAAENVDQHRFHALVAEQDLERVGDLLGTGAAAYIEKVRGHAAGGLDDVHGGHGQAGAVHHSADAAVELDVIQTVLRSLDLERIFLGDVTQFADIRMAEQRVVVEGKLGVEREKAAIGSGDERIDLEQGSVGVEKRLVEVGQKLHREVDLLGIESKPESHLARLKRLQPHAGIDVLFQNSVGILRSDLLDIHSAGGRGHEHWLAFGTVD